MQYTILTDADDASVSTAFKAVFLSKPVLTDYLKLTPQPLMRRKLRWGYTSAEDADMAAEILRAGMGAKLEKGVVFALSLERDEEGDGRQILQTWLPRYMGILGISASSGVLKRYTKFLAAELRTQGFEAEVAKLR